MPPPATALRKIFQRNLLQWYGSHARILPWRQQRNAYRVWLAEIIMQQTRVEQGTPYFERIIETYPTVQQLADAEEQQVLKLWQGLGYYSRARNLHHTAKAIAQQFHGEFPEDYATLRSLKGIGDYTAAAILSIAFGKPYAAVDGNVMRVLSRVFAISKPINTASAKKEFQILADALLDKKHPGNFNEALMELGAKVCTPRNPHCAECPLNSICEAFKTDSQEDYPKKIKKQQSPVVHLHYLVIRQDNKIWLHKRTNTGIWKNLYDFPLLENDKLETPSIHEIEERLPLQILEMEKIHTMTHILTHRRLIIHFYRCKATIASDNQFIAVPQEQLNQYPVPKPVEFFLSLLNKTPDFI